MWFLKEVKESEVFSEKADKIYFKDKQLRVCLEQFTQKHIFKNLEEVLFI